MTHIGQRKYHTPVGLANQVVEVLPNIRPNSAIDICCGSWNLLTAAQRRWPGTKLTGVDLDPNSAFSAPSGAQFFHGDGRAFAQRSMLIERKYDLVLANPPFALSSDRLWDMLEGQLGVALGPASRRIEAQMLVANACLVEQGGLLAAIVPSTVLEGETFESLRNSLEESFESLLVKELEPNSFPIRELKTYLLVLRKRLRKTSRERAPKYSDDQDIQGALPKTSSVTIQRGIISSKHLCALGDTPVLHSSGMPKRGEQWAPCNRFLCATEDVPPRAATVTQGDVLVCRVGRAAGYWSVYEGFPKLVSDCLLVVRSTDMVRLVQKLKKHEMYGCLLPFVKGVTVQYVSASDLKAFLAE